MDAYAKRRRVISFLLKKECPQRALLDPMGFQSLARDRGFSIWSDYLETWDRIGVLHPVIKVRRPFSYHLITERLLDGRVRYDPKPLDREPQEGEEVVKLYATWRFGPEQLCEWREHEQELVICPSVETFQPWSELKDKYIETVSSFYHPYQIFRLDEVHQLCHKTFPFPEFALARESWEKQGDRLQQNLEHMLKRLQQTEPAFLQVLALLLLIEDRYLPEVTGRISSYDFKLQGVQSWYEWAEAFDPDAALRESGLTVDEVKQIRQDLAEQGRRIDPNFDWYVLIRHATYDQRRRLRKEALLAWDYYEVAEMIGLFLEELTGEHQPHVDDLVTGGGQWKKDVYGVPAEDFDYGKATALPGILRHFGLDPRVKVLFVVEGDSEVAFVQRWCELKGIAPSAFGIRLVPLGGGELKARRTRQYLQDARGEGACVVVAVDDEQDAAQQLQSWVNDKLIDRIFEMSELENPETLPVGGMLWKPCFEDANFNFDELFEAWVDTINEGETKHMVDEDALKKAVDEALAYKPTIITAMEAVSERRRSRLPFSKPKIAKKLAERFADSDKPIILLLHKVIQLAQIARIARYETD